MDPREQLAAMQSLEEKGQSIIGIFHSHVNGPEGLSTTDLRETSYPEAAYLVWSRLNQDWKCKGFRVEEGRGIELRLVVKE
jgi:proteasome lid subunit RPN8/RPN11